MMIMCVHQITEAAVRQLHLLERQERNLDSINSCSTSKGLATTSVEQHLSTELRNILSHENELFCKRKYQDGYQDQLLSEIHLMHRFENLTRLRKTVLSEAGILVPLCMIKGEPSILYTLRASLMGAHQGEVSFPGGKKEDSDTNVIAAALRETNEEIGLLTENVKIWGCGASIPSRDQSMMVTPVVAHCGVLDPDQLKVSVKEVEEVFTVPIVDLCRTSNWRYTHFLTTTRQTVRGLRKRPRYVMPVYVGAKHRIWGLTAIVTYITLRTIANGHFLFRLPKL